MACERYDFCLIEFGFHNREGIQFHDLLDQQGWAVVQHLEEISNVNS